MQSKPGVSTHKRNLRMRADKHASVMCFTIACIVIFYLVHESLSATFTTVYDRVYDNRTHTEKVLEGCGEICETSKDGTPSKFFNFIEKKVDCHALMSNEAIDAAMVEDEPPQSIPTELLPAFTYDGRVQVKFDRIYNQRYLAKTALTSRWDQALINEWQEQCRQRTLKGSYGLQGTIEVLAAMQYVNVTGATVLVIGSEHPWIEACMLSLGARDVVTLEYGGIVSSHPHVHTLTPSKLRANCLDYIGKFDTIVTYSSLEHSGIGRYGDAMNPWGDRQAVARAWCMAKKGGKLVIGLPSGPDLILYNAHRQYGTVQLPHLLANWHQLWQSPGGLHRMWVCEK